MTMFPNDCCAKAQSCTCVVDAPLRLTRNAEQGRWEVHRGDALVSTHSSASDAIALHGALLPSGLRGGDIAND